MPWWGYVLLGCYVLALFMALIYRGADRMFDHVDTYGHDRPDPTAPSDDLP